MNITLGAWKRRCHSNFGGLRREPREQHQALEDWVVFLELDMEVGMGGGIR